MELKEDKISVVKIGDKILVTRIMVEEFDLDEHDRNINRLKFSVEQMTKQKEESEKMIASLQDVKEVKADEDSDRG